MTSAEPLISILMPAYNAEKYVDQSLQSLLAQTYPHWELLVADDGSNDDTRVRIDSYSDARIRRFHNAVNEGYLATWNKLLSHARGEYITFLDADDYLHEHRLQLLVDYLGRHPDTHICGTGIAFVSPDQKLVSTRIFPVEWSKIQKNLYDPTNFPFCGSAVMVRREVTEEIGGYRPFFDRAGWEDHDWLIRCCERFKASNIPDLMYYYRQTPSSVTRSLDVSALSIRRLIIKKVGIELALQRRNTGSDYVMQDNQVGLTALLEKYEKPYRKDQSLIYRIMSHRALQEGNHRLAFSLLLRGVRKNPFHPSNYVSIFRTLLRARLS